MVPAGILEAEEFYSTSAFKLQAGNIVGALYKKL
jgi:hypothetical protein